MKFDVTSTRRHRALLRCSHPLARELLMLVTVTLPAERSVDLTVSVQAAPTVAPAAGKRGKKFWKDPMIRATDCEDVVSDATGLRNSPVGDSRPASDRPFAPARLIPMGTVVPESGAIESTVIVVG